MGHWDSVWRDFHHTSFRKETYMWKFYELLLNNYDFRGKRVLEIGCGTGINTIMMALRGARVTFLDSSMDSLKYVEENMKGFGVDGELLHGNALDFGFSGEFDLTHSEGVIEHFSGKERQAIVNMHGEALKRRGHTAIIVPNLKSGPYRLGKFLSEVSGRWIHGYEYPYTKTELLCRLERAGLKLKVYAGGELFFALGWLLSPVWLGSSILRKSIQYPANMKIFKLNYNNLFANQYGRTIAAVAVKP